VTDYHLASLVYACKFVIYMMYWMQYMLITNLHDEHNNQHAYSALTRLRSQQSQHRIIRPKYLWLKIPVIYNLVPALELLMLMLMFQVFYPGLDVQSIADWLGVSITHYKSSYFFLRL